MSDPVLHLLAGPNGAGKSTLYETIVRPATHLKLVNADAIAAARWPEDPSGRSYEAAAAAADQRAELIGQRRSFVTGTVFSHGSKLELLRAARTAGYLVTLHVVMVPEELSVARVTSRVVVGGHTVPEQKIRLRFQRLWPLVAEAIKEADNTVVYDNTRAKQPFRVVATFERGARVGTADWPRWAPKVIQDLDG
jgi:predicted ABC-type ATPase